ncbi:MAG: hypothetical protein IKC38_05310 [Clostridia bacterium]|nr:hypothetical protein [Clostridia bacterium]
MSSFFGKGMYDKNDRQKFSKEGRVLFVIFIVTVIVFTIIFLKMRLDAAMSAATLTTQ